MLTAHDDSQPNVAVVGGVVATEDSVGPANLLIGGERIVAVLAPDAQIQADEVIDATNLVVMPGAVDPHVHFEDPGTTHREDFRTGTMTAAAGGVTTVFEHPLTDPPPITAELYAQKRELARSKAVIDFGLWGALTPESILEIQAAHREGARGFKAFTPASDPGYPNVDDAELLDGMREVASFGGLVLVHSENDAMLRSYTAKLRAAGRTDVRAHYESRPPITELEAVSRVILLARHAEARLQVVHVSVPAAARAVGDAKRRGESVTMEVCPHHLLLDEDVGIELGPYGHCAPPLRSRELVEGLWEFVLDGTADCLVSDHAPYTRDEKEAGRSDIFLAPLGLQVLQEMIPLMLEEAVKRRGMDLSHFVRFTSANAARRLGLYPRKGSIRPGSDADLSLFDLESQWTVRAEEQQVGKNPWSPFEGRPCSVRLVRTISRGRTAFVEGEVGVTPGTGRFLSSQDGVADRAQDDPVLTGSASS